ncbi:PfkB family carbohydrate kinase [Pseudooceanicola sp. LIPI14-2-Ac024]|uniref:PfkB family carbohydrate kinase n=1 Tax=Pseudooceanicola sp. LIPI14-2-Ac024 TaxID=3344875 RepID=UPI0035CEEFE5
MTTRPDILCIGAVLWDIIGRSASHMERGSDVPGRITRLPGGVAMNIAMAAQRFGLNPILLTAVGRDPEGEELIRSCARMGMGMDHVYRSPDLPTDRYMAVEGGNGLIAAIADAHSLEAAGARILTPLRDGTLGSAEAPWRGRVALDGNLTTDLLREIANDPAFAAADLRIAPASPGKAERLHVFLGHPSAVFYVNLEEAGLLCQKRFDDSRTAAEALLKRGAARAVVTDGGGMATDAGAHGTICRQPRAVLVTRVTGAGDTFMAAHMAAEAEGAPPEAAMETALTAAADYVSGDTSL